MTIITIIIITYYLYYYPPQAHCPIYLVNVASMSAGDVLASGKMHGKGHSFVCIHLHLFASVFP